MHKLIWLSAHFPHAVYPSLPTLQTKTSNQASNHSVVLVFATKDSLVVASSTFLRRRPRCCVTASSDGCDFFNLIEKAHDDI